MDQQEPTRAAPPRLLLIGLIIAAVAGGAYCFTQFETKIHRSEDGQFQGITVTPRNDQTETDLSGRPAGGPSRPAIRIATFDLGGLDEKKLANREVGDLLVRALSMFDVVAVQDVRTRNRGALLRLVELINAAGRPYRLATERHALAPSCAFLFDPQSIEIDRSAVESVEDHRGRFRHRPLVALFRVRGLDPHEAFTFKLVNIYIDPDHPAAELDLLDDVYRSVRDDGANEDDVILLGNFATDTEQMRQFDEILDVISAIAGTPTTLGGIRPVDNIFFDCRATAEFTGRAGVLDLARQFEVPASAARQVSDHLPVWAEFSSREGGVLDHMLASPGEPR